MSKQNVLIIALVLCLTIMGLATCQQAPLEIKVGVLAILNGQYKDTSGQPTVEAAQLAVKKINDAGGLDVSGRKVKITLVVEDDGNTPETAVAAAKKLINQEGVVALVGPQFSKNALPVADVAQAAKIPMISPMSTNAKLTAGKSYVFRVGFIDDFQGQVMANFAKNDLKAHKAAVLYDVANTYSSGLANTFKQEFEKGGGQIVAFESYTTDNMDVTIQLGKIKASGATVVFLPNYNETMTQTAVARQLGIGATFLGGDTWNSLNFAQYPSLEDSFYSTHWQLANDNPESQAFVAAYRQAYSKDPRITAALTYDAVNMLLQAIQAQGKTDPDSIRAGFASIKGYTGVSGLITYAGSGDPTKSAVVMTVKDSKIAFYKLVNP